MQNKRKLGQEQEQRASETLEKEGYRILQKNYRCKIGEIDLIAVDEGVLVFIEVKYRRTTVSGYPEEAVTVQKQKQISRVAAWYLMENQLSLEVPCRFDVVAVSPEKVRIYKNAFDYLGA